MYNFNVKKVKEDLIEWIRDYFEHNGKQCKAVVGISGGKDSSIVASLCVEALGKDRVFGVLMPQGSQDDIQCSYDLINHLEINYTVINIGETSQSFWKTIDNTSLIPNSQAIINTPARIRMTTLYAVSAMIGGRVANTCNLSEDWVGYATRYGDSVGDFSPLSNLTVTEVKQLGVELGLPIHLVEKTPIDGLCGKTDEDNLGFTYNILDKYIRTGECESKVIKNKIDDMHEKNKFKLELMPSFDFN